MQDIHHQLFSFLPVQHQHRDCDVRQQMVAFIKIFKIILLGHDISNGYLQLFDDFSIIFLNKWQACEMSIFWKISHFVFLHSCQQIFFVQDYNNIELQSIPDYRNKRQNIERVSFNNDNFHKISNRRFYQKLLHYYEIHLVHIPSIILISQCFSIANQLMIMYSSNESYPPQPHLQNFHSNHNHNNQPFSFEECSPQVSSKLKTFHVEIRNHELKEYKNKIRNELLRSSEIDKLLEQMPTCSESARIWAQKLGEQYAKTYKYVLPSHKAVEIFKTAQKFPNKQTLQLLQIIVVRVQSSTIDELFQYDVMRLLHGFINFTGGSGHYTRRETTIEEVQIIKEVVITTASNQIQRGSTSSISYFEKLELARITIRIISNLCKKQAHIRNFAILSHKTFGYCLKAFNIFGEGIKLEFYMFLEAATYFDFQRLGEQQFRRISTKIINCFFQEKMSIKIQLLDQNEEKSCLKAYQYIIIALKNLLQMSDLQTVAKILRSNEMGELAIIPILTSLVSQCNYVLSYPAIHDKKEEIMPLNILAAIIELIMNIKDHIDRMPLLNINCNITQLVRQFLRFLQYKNNPMTYPRGIIARRGVYFILANIFYQQLSEQELFPIIYFNNSPNENLINLLAYYLQSQTDNINIGEIGNTLRSIFTNLPPHIIQPLLIPSEIFIIMIEIILNPVYTNEGQLVSNLESSSNLILLALQTFFKHMGEKIERISIYTNIVNSYSERLYTTYDMLDIHSQFRQIVINLIKTCKSGADFQSL